MSNVKTPLKAEYPTLLKAQRRHIGALRDRRDYLRRRAVETPGCAATYHVAEANALDWVLNLVEEEFGT